MPKSIKITVTDKKNTIREQVVVTASTKNELRTAVENATKGTIDSSKVTILVNKTGRKVLGAK